MADIGTLNSQSSAAKSPSTRQVFSIVLERISGNQLNLTSLKGDASTFMPNLSVDDIFTWTA